MRRGSRVVIGVAVTTAALALVGAGIWWTTRVPAKAGPDTLAMGLAAYSEGNWRKALSWASQRLDERPGDREAIRLLARSSARLNRLDDAKAFYDRLGGPDFMQAEDYYLLGAGLLRVQESELASAALELAYKADPNHAETLNELARVYSQNDQIEDAVALVERLARIPGWEARGALLLGVLKEQENDPASAAKALREAIRLDPTLKGAPASVTPAAVRKLLARALLETERPAEARAELKAVLDKGPDPEASWLLSRAFIQEGSVAEAARALEQAGEYAADHPEAAEPAAFVGAVKCQECHASLYHAQQSSLHARTFRYGSELADLPLPEPGKADPFNDQVHHTIARDGDGLRMETRADGKLYKALVDYAFGSGDRGLTLVGHDESGQSRELRLSRYNDGSGWDRTTGHPFQPDQPSGYLGKPLAAHGVRRCMICHVTNFRATRTRTGPEAADHGIGCERCHGPGGNHLKAVAADFTDLAIGQPQLASGPQVVKLCGQCHSPRGMEANPASPASVRSQASTLSWSKCYKESQGALSCVSCHNPHRNADTDLVSYEAKCLTCHSTDPPPSTKSTGTRPIDRSKLSRIVPCPVNPAKDCIRCHMPVVKNVVPHSPFTDHNIRVHREVTSAASR